MGTARRDLLNGRVCDPISLNCVDNVTAYSAGVGLVQHVIDPSGWAAIRGAGRALDGHRFDAVDRRRTLTLAAVDALALVMMQERLAESGRMAVKDTIERAELVRKAITLGALPPGDAVRADQDLLSSTSTTVFRATASCRAGSPAASLKLNSDPLGSPTSCRRCGSRHVVGQGGSGGPLPGVTVGVLGEEADELG